MEDAFPFSTDPVTLGMIPETIIKRAYTEKTRALFPANTTINFFSMCPVSFGSYKYFALLSRGNCSIYRICNDESIALLQAFNDDDKTEEFSCCDWIVINKAESSDVFLVVGGRTGCIKTLNLIRRTVSQILTGHSGAICCIKAVKYDDYMIISGGTDGTLRLWDVRVKSYVHLIRFANPFDNLVSIDVGIQGDRCVCSDTQGTVIVYSLQNGDIVEESLVYKSTNFPVLWVGRLLLSVVNGHNDSMVIKIYKQFHTHAPPQMMCLNNDASVLAILSRGCVEFFHVDTDTEPYSSLSLSYLPSPPLSISFCHTDDYLLVVTKKKHIVLYAAVSEQPTIVTGSMALPLLPFEELDRTSSSFDFFNGDINI